MKGMMTNETNEPEYVDYILLGNKQPLTWKLRQPVLVNYEGKGMKYIAYYQGATSILTTQNENLKPFHLDFINGKLRVLKADKTLNKFLTMHSEFDVKFKLHDPEADAAKELEALEIREKAKDKIRNADTEMLRAVAVILFDNAAYNYGDRTVKLKCFDYADREPKKMIQLLDDPKTQVRYLVALSFLKGIVITNMQKTAVLWEDNQKQIIPLAKGETAIEKMADFLYNDKNATTLQELSKRVTDLAVAS